ncbi:hypothetical protein PENTCL1PPCAC_20632, partial [Pristionchus entomophagus]
RVDQQQRRRPRRRQPAHRPRADLADHPALPGGNEHCAAVRVGMGRGRAPLSLSHAVLALHLSHQEPHHAARPSHTQSLAAIARPPQHAVYFARGAVSPREALREAQGLGR